MTGYGSFCFGLVIGFITYRTLQHLEKTAVSDIAAVIGAVGGAAVLKLFPVGESQFDNYAFGLAIGFFAYLVVNLVLSFKTSPQQAKAMLERGSQDAPLGQGKTF